MKTFISYWIFGLPFIYLLIFLSFYIHELENLRKTKVDANLQAQSILNLFQHDSIHNVYWNLTYANRQLYLLDSPSIYVGPNFVLREYFECKANGSNAVLDLSLCFSASHKINWFLVKNANGTNQTRSEFAKKLEKYYIGNSRLSMTPPNYTAFTLTEHPKRQPTKHPIAQEVELDIWIRLKLKEFVELALECLEYLEVDSYILAGSAIATYRHLDQIPWDEDFDVSVPTYQLAWLIGFFNKGEPLGKNAAMDAAANMWWKWYVEHTPNVIRDEAESRYCNTLAFYVASDPREEARTSAKIYWKYGPDDVHPLPWKFPFLDLFSFDFVEEDKTLYIHHNWVKRKLLASTVFPVRYRPMGHLIVPVPSIFPGTKNTFLDKSRVDFQCWSGDLSHYHEYRKPSVFAPCKWFYDRIPFVTERKHAVLHISKLPKFASNPQSSFKLNRTITSSYALQKNFQKLELFFSQQKKPITTPIPHALVRVWNTYIMKKNPTYFNDRLFDLLKDEIQRLDFFKNDFISNVTVLTIYEQLTVQGIVMAELIDFGLHYFNAPDLDLGKFLAASQLNLYDYFMLN